jgi:hypothetical protein
MRGVTKAYYSISVPIPSTRPIHRWNVDPGAVHKPVLKGDQVRTILINLWMSGHTSVTIIPIIGPTMTV